MKYASGLMSTRPITPNINPPNVKCLQISETKSPATTSARAANPNFVRYAMSLLGSGIVSLIEGRHSRWRPLYIGRRQETEKPSALFRRLHHFRQGGAITSLQRVLRSPQQFPKSLPVYSFLGPSGDLRWSGRKP